MMVSSFFTPLAATVTITIATLIHISICPYTKVEESFNIQAVHDILYHTTDFSKYDHHTFPGVVPRSFIGPLILALPCAPVKIITQTIDDIYGADIFGKFFMQYVTRVCLGCFVLAGLFALLRAIEYLYGRTVLVFFTVITVTQFHFIFYISRTLPNIFALIPALFTIRSWLIGSDKMFIFCAAFSCIVFRSELCILFGLMLLYNLVQFKISVRRVFYISIPSAVVCLSLTIIIDSLFWGRLIWPEGTVLWYNTILNKSVNWGTSPFLWYFYSALPRMMGCSLFLVPIGLIIDSRFRGLLVPFVGFIFLYSFLPHKELRFIIYVLPMFNTVVARTCQYFYINLSKSLTMKIINLVIILHLFVNLILSAMLLYISSLNYPGGVALTELHNIINPSQQQLISSSSSSEVNVHIDNLACQTGVTRFGQLNPDWIYDKSEILPPSLTDLCSSSSSFTHLIVESDSWPPSHQHGEKFRVLAEVIGYDNIQIQPSWFPVKIVLKSKLLIVQCLTKLSQSVHK